MSVFRISQKRADRFPWNFSRLIGVIGTRKRIKTSGKFRPWMCKNWENGAKWPISRKSPWVTRAGVRNGLRSEFSCSPVRWQVVRQRHGQITRGPGGVARSLLCGTVSNAFCSWVQFSDPTSRPTFGQINASYRYKCFICIDLKPRCSHRTNWIDPNRTVIVVSIVILIFTQNEKLNINIIHFHFQIQTSVLRNQLD